MRSAPSEQCDNVSDRGVTGSQIKTEYALIAQSVEHAAVNRGVTGSSPVWGAREKHLRFASAFLLAWLIWTRRTSGTEPNIHFLPTLAVTV